MASLVLSVDIGSSSYRCSAYDFGNHASNGKSIKDELPEFVQGSLAMVPHRLDDEGGLDVEKLYQGLEDCVDKCVEQCVKLYGNQVQFSTIAISCFVMNLFGVNSAGKPVTKLLSYAAANDQVQRESKLQYEQAVSSKTLDEHINNTGTRYYHSSYALSQLLTLDKNGSFVAETVDLWTTIPSFILSKWTRGDTGRHLDEIGVSEAAWMGMLNIYTLDWDQGLMKLLPPAISNKLPKISSEKYLSCSLSPKYTAKWPALGNAKLHFGFGDGLAANVGSLCVNECQMAVTAGTSAAARVILTRTQLGLDAGGDTKNRIPRGLWCYCIDKDRVLLGGAITDGGSVFEWVQSTFNLGPDAEAEAMALKPDEHHLTVLPFLRGERSVGWRDDARLTINGISASTRPHHILRACMDAVAIRLSLVIEEILMVCPDRDNVKLITSGNTLERSLILRQAISDIINQELYTSDWAMMEATSRGAAVWAYSSSTEYLHALGVANEPNTRCSSRPVPENVAIYAASELPKHLGLYSKLYTAV
mmetsp:Transcript_13801/g.24516  ORF Transcript_13801/g.24516 Transcript_13801/m.24516 type:complete len:532 (+) Transcript_13801:181-1776(+)